MSETFIQLVEKFGVSFSFLVFLTWCLYRLAFWLGEKVIMPIQERHLEFLDKLENGIETVINTQNKSFEILNQVLLNTKEMSSFKKNVKVNQNEISNMQ
jgi:hypothetical protein